MLYYRDWEISLNHSRKFAPSAILVIVSKTDIELAVSFARLLEIELFDVNSRLFYLFNFKLRVEEIIINHKISFSYDRPRAK